MPDVFTLLETDHRVVENLLDELSSSKSGPEREELVRKLTTSLQRHMQFEEEAIYPLLARMDSEMEEEAEVEHGLARDGLAKLAELAAAPGFGAAVDMVKAGIGHHVEEEEHEVFPKLRRSCTDATMNELGDTLMGMKAQAGTLVDDLQAASKDDLLALAKEAHIDGRSSMTKEQLVSTLASR